MGEAGMVDVRLDAYVEGAIPIKLGSGGTMQSRIRTSGKYSATFSECCYDLLAAENQKS